MSYKRITLILIFMFLFVGCDQSSKQFAKYHLENSSAVSYAGGLVRFVYMENAGAIFGIGSELPESLRFAILLIGIAAIIYLFISSVIIKKQKILLKEISLIILLSGGIGNLMDRIFNEGRVIDFIIIGTKNFHTAVFNLADLFILTGTFLFVVSSFREKTQ
ncbi:MAG: signal peptidase II [Ignavibacteriaceae bacterium]